MWTANGKNWTLSSVLGFGAVCLCLQQWNTTDNNNSLNVNNRVASTLFPQTLPPEIALKGFWWIADLKQYIFLNQTFVNFDCDLACTFQNVCECTWFLHRACTMPFFMFCKLTLKHLAKKIECIKCLQSFFGIHASHMPVKDACT